jgi:hypothetical protein
MTTNEEILKSNEHIPTQEVMQDIQDTKAEIKQLEREVEGLRLIGDKLSMFKADAKTNGIKDRRSFIRELEHLLALREHFNA